VALAALTAAGLPTLWTGLSPRGADPASFVDPFIGTGPTPSQTGTTGFDTTGLLGGEQFRYVPFLPLTRPVTTSPAVLTPPSFP
jgi:hypothetical protein